MPNMTMCFIRPASVTTLDGMGDDAVPPLGLAYLAATMEGLGHTVTIVDGPGEALGHYMPVEGMPGALRHGLSDAEIVTRIPEDARFIGVTCMFSLEWLSTRELLGAIRHRFPDAVIICGGEHFTALPELSLNSCPAIDYCVLGEGEQTLTDLVEAVSTGKDPGLVGGLCLRGPSGPVRTGDRPRLRELEAIPRPAWHLTPIERYLDGSVMGGINFGRSMPIMASRGCPYRCTFCSNPGMWGVTWRARPPQDVLDEMKSYTAKYRATNFDFYDLTAIVKREWIVEFCNRIIDDGTRITWQFPSGTRTDVLDAEITRLLHRSGCAFITYAPESGSPDMLKRIKKQVDPVRMLASARGAVRNGLNVKASFILGFPTERVRHVLESFRFILQLAVAGIQDVSVFPFSPYPGSELFGMLVNRGDIVVNDEYFRGLIRGTAALPGQDARCLTEYRSVRLLRAFCLMGVGMFYAVSFGLRPWRLVRLIRNLVRHRETTRLERALSIVRNRRARVQTATVPGK